MDPRQSILTTVANCAAYVHWLRTAYAGALPGVDMSMKQAPLVAYSITRECNGNAAVYMQHKHAVMICCLARTVKTYQRACCKAALCNWLFLCPTHAAAKPQT